MRLRKFLIVVVEIFIILILYKFLNRLLGISFGAYLLIAIILLFFLNRLFSELGFMGEPGRTFIYKIASRMAFTKDWFGILTMACVVAGFFLSDKLIQSAFLTYTVIILGLVFAYSYLKDPHQKIKERGLLLVGFLIGIGIGSRYAEGWFVIMIFVLGNFFLYLSTVPGERESGLQ